MKETTMPYLDDTERLKAFQLITEGCVHLWSKGKLQQDRLHNVLDTFMKLADEDPYFLAHFTSYAVKNLDSKDLKVVSIFINSLNDADGTQFSEGSDFRKPNLRLVSQAGIQELDPKLVKRVGELANIKQALGKRYKEGTHFSNSLKTAIKKYLKFRENNPKAMEGIKKAGFAPTVKNIYRMVHLAPSTDTAGILGWSQKDGRKIEKKNLLDFKGLKDIEIAEKIRSEKISVMGALGALPDKISPVIAVALLEQATGNQAVILRGLFDSQGLLKHEEVMQMFKDKIKTAKTALDRVERINTEVDKAVEKVLKTAKAEKRKEDVGDIGKVFVHLDVSSSMDDAIKFAMERGAIIAECIQNPKENFHWGAFNISKIHLNKPEKFEKDAFMSILYGLKSGGATDCLAWYKEARKLECDVDIYITDQEHNGKPIAQTVQECDDAGLGRPKAVVIVNFGIEDHRRLIGRRFTNFQRMTFTYLSTELEALGIPVVEIKPNTLTESALISQAVRTAILGATSVIDDIMNTPLLKLPEWWSAVS